MYKLHTIKKELFDGAYAKGKDLGERFGSSVRLLYAIPHIIHHNNAIIARTFSWERIREISKQENYSIEKMSKIEAKKNAHYAEKMYHYRKIRDLMPEICEGYSLTHDGEYHHPVTNPKINYDVFHSLRNEYEIGEEYEDFLDDAGKHFFRGVDHGKNLHREKNK